MKKLIVIPENTNLVGFRPLFICSEENATHCTTDNGTIVYLSHKRYEDATCLSVPIGESILFWMKNGKKLSIA